MANCILEHLQYNRNTDPAKLQLSAFCEQLISARVFSVHTDLPLIMTVHNAFTLLISLFIQNFAGIHGSCPDGWLDASFLNMGCLLLDQSSPGKLGNYTWGLANSWCRGLGGALVEVGNEEQLEFLRLQLQLFEEEVGEERYWWTSGTEVDGVWLWASSLSPVEEFIWGDEFPTDWLEDFNCLELCPYCNDYKGANFDCDTSRHPICQIK